MRFSIFIDGVSFDDDFNEYDFVLLDIGLPGIDGIELSKKNEHKAEYIILFTSVENRVYEVFDKMY